MVPIGSLWMPILVSAVAVFVASSIVHMVLHPPGYRLDVEIPRINGVVAVAIITGFLQDILHIPGNSEVRSHLIPGKGGGNVLGRPDKLDDDQYGD